MSDLWDFDLAHQVGQNRSDEVEERHSLEEAPFHRSSAQNTRQRLEALGS